MNNVFNDDFTDFIEALNKFDVRYLLVGGYAVILHGYNRTTGDVDFLIDNTEENYNKLMLAFQYFGLPMVISLKEFLNSDEKDVFTFGRPPVAINIMTKLSDFEFDELFNQSFIKEVGGVTVRIIHYNHLIASKQKANRYKDLNDIEELQKIH